MENLKIMSHNVWGMFGANPVKRVDNRRDLMREIYLEQLPDVLGTQEFSIAMRESGLANDLLENGYCELNVSHDVEAYGMSNLFTPIFYRKDSCDVLNCGFFLFPRNFNNHDSKGVAWGIFRHKYTGAVFSVANTHFWYKGGEEHDLVRRDNAIMLLDVMKPLPKPWFIMGDLNCKTDSPAYKTLSGSGLSDAQLAAPDTILGKAHHPYPEYDFEKQIFYGAPVPMGDYTESYDHIFVDSEHCSSVNRFVVLTDQNALDTSDHCPIFLEYQVKSDVSSL